MVCSHAQRDARCGYCGPKLIASLEQTAREQDANVTVRGCSHIGGHRYAGNAIVFRDDDNVTCDWLGFLTATPEDSEYVVDLATGKIDFPNPRTWRGRRGVSKDEHRGLCAACAEEGGDMEDIGLKPKPNVLFVLGGPGSGKGTQCAKIAETYDFCHLSAGELLREEREKPGSEYGAEIEEYIRNGRIVPTPITTRLLQNAMKKSGRSNFLVDGFPRNSENLDGWKRHIKNEAKVLGVLFLDCPEEVLEKRLLKRGETSGRSDDNREAIQKRFEVFNETTLPVVELYEKRNRGFRVNANQDVDAVFTEIQDVLKGRLGLSPMPEKPRVLFVLGGPGAGKGTQCEKIVEEFDFEHLSAGELLRAERRNPDSVNGQLIERYIKEGLIVPVDITVQLLLSAMQKSKQRNFLIDGFPRNEDNLMGWQRVVGGQADVLGCLFFDCSESVMEERLLARGKTSGRSDDNIESIRKRFRTYINDTRPIIDRFASENKTFRVASDRPVDAVYSQVQALLKDQLKFEPRAAPTSSLLDSISRMPRQQKAVLGVASVAVLAFVGYRAMNR